MTKSFFTLHEAYLNVYNKEELDEVSGCKGKVDPVTGKYADGTGSRMLLPPKEKATMMARRKELEGDPEKAKKISKVIDNMKESKNLYMIFVDHLLDEGYVDNVDSAVLMIDEWLEEIKN
jgi:hypothetical protein